MTFDPNKPITVICIDTRYDYKPRKRFTLTGDGGRRDMEEIEDLMSWCFEREKKDPHVEYTALASVEGA